MSKIIIAYGSETGNAEQLAKQLTKQFNERSPSLAPRLCELNDVDTSELTPEDTLLIISSNFGDGEPTGNASEFFDRLYEQVSTVDCQYAVFGLGDVSYPKFCGFTIDLDKKLAELGATPIANRVDADTSYQAFFQQWSEALCVYFSGNAEPLKSLQLQVKAYGEDQSYLAKVHSVKRINQGEFPVYDIEIDIAGSGMNYQAGDLLYMLPPVNQPTFQRILAFYNECLDKENGETSELSDTQQTELATKELRLLAKPLIRAFAKQTKNSELKALTKMSASKQLADYIYGRDVADLLNDYCTPETMPIDALLAILSKALPRAYSIASCGSTSPELVRLCVREVSYQLDGKDYVGSGSHFLCQADSTTPVAVYVRANEHFHLPTDPQTPIIMVGSGTGIAPYIGFLASEQAKGRTGESHLFFGERHRDGDYLYQTELENYLASGELTAIHTAFSRDQAEKIYVQDVFLQQGKKVWELLQQGGEIYVCGSRANLNKPMAQALANIAQTYGNLSEEDAKNYSNQLVSEQRYHLDLY